MKKVCELLARTPLFAGLDHDLYHDCCQQTPIKTYWKGEVIINEGDLCTGVGVVVEGQVARQKYSASGEYTTLNLLGPECTFGEDLMFSTSKEYPYTLEAVVPCKVVFISRENLLAMISQSPHLLLNYLRLLSDRTRELDRRIDLLSQKPLRLKICSYLLHLLRQELEKEGRTLEEALAAPTTYAVELPVSKEVVARLLAMPRPSFSRELISMEKDELIRVNGRVIWLVDIRGLACGLVEDCESDDDDES